MRATRQGARLAVALSAAITALAIASPLAQAHDSAFTGHYTLSGENWQLVYTGYLNQNTSNCYGNTGQFGTNHFHQVNHNYRQVPNQGPYYYFYHQRYHFVVCTQGTPTLAAQSASTDAAPAPETVEGDTAGTHNPRPELCRRFGMYCNTDRPGRRAADAATAIRKQVPVRVVRLRPSTLGPGPYEADPIAKPPASDCVTEVLDAGGTGAAEAGKLGRGVTLEVADPSTTRSLGHTC